MKDRMLKTLLFVLVLSPSLAWAGGFEILEQSPAAVAKSFLQANNLV